MKKNLFVIGIGFLFIGASIFSACTKEGPMGPAGTNGTNGSNGTNGTDGTATCIVCHSSDQSIYIRETQWAASVHATGTAFERNTADCATCHTSQGFRGKLDGSYDETAAGAIINNPMPQNCYTCHKIHETYTGADLALTVVAGTPITLRNTTSTKDFGKGNLCVTCHQARVLNPYPTVGGADIAVTNTHYGLHHGTQGNFIAGVGFGLFEVGTGLVNSAHSSAANTCVTCHMADGVGTKTGGHTFNVGPTINQTGCKTAGCHDPAENVATLAATFQTGIEGLMADLKVKLDAHGITAAGSDSPKVGTYPPTVVGAYIDYAAMLDDKSMGVHNPKYVTKLLQNLIAAL
jgi:hypothetical protein